MFESFLGETNLIAGGKGSGKSTLLARICQRQLLAGDECWSYKDFKFKDPRVKYFESIEEIPELRHCTVFIDEAQEHFDSYEWEKMSKSFRLKLSKARHSFLDIWAATQDPMFLAPRFRRSVDHYFEISKIWGTNVKRGKDFQIKKSENPWLLSFIREYDIKRSENVTRKVKGYGWKFLKFDKKEMDFFDSFVEYNDIKDEAENENFRVTKVNCWTCKKCGHKSYRDPNY